MSRIAEMSITTEHSKVARVKGDITYCHFSAFVFDWTSSQFPWKDGYFWLSAATDNKTELKETFLMD